MDSPPPDPPASVDQLPAEALALAGRLFEAARRGQMDILEQALPRGLKPNMTDEKGDSLVGVDRCSLIADGLNLTSCVC
jgi:hypothetical protein